uniref:Transmembrane protein 138 n=2 Tax=Clytia hemisphaerica TaxID=252671 RepID=A0A7M5V950_9CNID
GGKNINAGDFSNIVFKNGILAVEQQKSKQNVNKNETAMQVSRYKPVVYLQFFLLLIDILINSFAEIFRADNVVLLVLFVIQDVGLLLSLIVLFLVFFNTFVFRAGVIFLLVRKFKTTLLCIILYLMLSVGLHIWTMSRKWGDDIKYIWFNGFQALYAIQRIVSVVYYFTYKRAMVKLSDPKYYRDTEWLRKELARIR